MKRKDLKALELSDEAIDAIMALHGASVEETKATLETAKNQATQYKTQLDEANVKIESFKGLKSPEEVEAAIGEWKTKAESAEREFNEKLNKINFDINLEKTLKEKYGVKNVKAVRLLLNPNDLKENEQGAIIGLDEQLKPIKESEDYAPFFEAAKTEPPPKVTTKTNPKPNEKSTTFAGAIEDRLKSQI